MFIPDPPCPSSCFKTTGDLINICPFKIFHDSFFEILKNFGVLILFLIKNSLVLYLSAHIDAA